MNGFFEFIRTIVIILFWISLLFIMAAITIGGVKMLYDYYDIANSSVFIVIKKYVLPVYGVLFLFVMAKTISDETRK